MFDNLIAGDYQIRFTTLPAGYRPTAQTTGTDRGLDSNADQTGLTAVFTLNAASANVRPVAAGDGATTASLVDPTIDMGIWMPLAIGDYVWNDLNHDGVQGALEPGVAGVTVVLLTTDGTVIATTTTDANGHYVFDNVGAGDYQVKFSNLPTGYAFTSQSVPGATLGNDSNPNPTDGLSPVFTVAPGGANMRPVESADGTTTAREINPTIDAGIWLPASIGDYVWFDDNRNGVQDAGEVGVPSVTVSLLGADGRVVAAVVTDASGHYEFVGLTPGEYQIRFELGSLPSETFVTGVNLGGDPALDSDGDSTTGLVAPTSLIPGENDRTFDLGIYRRDYDLALAKTIGRVEPSTNTITWVITVTNNGRDSAPGPITITDDLIDKLTFVSGGSDKVTCAPIAQRVTCTTGELVSGAKVSFDLVTTYKGNASALTNTASVAAAPGQLPEKVGANNSATAKVTAGSLPATGLAIGGFVSLGALLIGLGLILWGRRRRNIAASA